MSSHAEMLRGERTAEDMDAIQASRLSHVEANPAERGEQIAQALGTDAASMRKVIQDLIADGKVETEGQRGRMPSASDDRSAPAP